MSKTPLNLPALASVRKHIQLGRCQAGAKPTNILIHTPPPAHPQRSSPSSAHLQPCTPPRAGSGRRAPASQSR